MTRLMARRVSFTSLLVLTALTWGCAAAPSSPTARLEAEARAFMEAYARDLRAGDAEAVADRYSRSGAYRLGNGRKEFTDWQDLRTFYLERWQPPSRFDWLDLSYDVIGPDAIAVLGRFRWGTGSTAALEFSYTGLLVRDAGQLHIRVEDESRALEP